MQAPPPPPKPPAPPPPAPVVVALSGTGRSLEGLHAAAAADPGSAYKICGVITSNAHCRGYEVAKNLGLPVWVESFTPPSKTPSKGLLGWLYACKPQWIALAGFLKIFPTEFPPCAPWQGHIINIHPSLLPAFAGKNMYGSKVHTAVLQAGARESGATVHFVNERYDEGRLIAQTKVAVWEGDTADVLAARVFAAETKLFPKTLADLARGALPLNSGGVFIYDFDHPVTSEKG